MPPTVQTSSKDDRDRRNRGTGERSPGPQLSKIIEQCQNSDRFEGNQLKGNLQSFDSARSKLVTEVIKRLDQRFESDSKMLKATSIARLVSYPSKLSDFPDYGNEEIMVLGTEFREALMANGVEVDELLPTWIRFKTFLYSKSELVCRIKYNNTLPDIPFDPKFLTYPFETNRFVQYNPTSLERSYRFELQTETDLGVPIDLINPETYQLDPNAYLDYEDEKLLEEEVAAQQDSKRSARHNKTVSWLRKTEYISTEYNRFKQKADKAESRIGHSLKKLFKEEDIYRDRESQIKAIEDTFEFAKKPIDKHYSKPGVTPVEVLPIFPDFKLWKHPCAQVIFDSDPAPPGRPSANQIEELSQAMIRGMVDEEGNQFVAYFLPSEETLGKRKRDAEINIDYEENEEYDYYLAREYNWNVKNKLSKGYEETYFFVMRDEGVYYNELETRVRLSKRRKLGTAPVNKSRLIVKNRPMVDAELGAHEARMSMLEPPVEEEEEEMQVNVVPDEEKEAMDRLGSGDESGKEEGSPRRSRSRSRSRSASGSRSGSGSRSRSRSRSGSRSVSRSRSRSASGSRSRSRSRSASSRSRSRSRNGSRTPSRSGSRSRSPSRSRSGSGSDSGSGSEDEGKKAAEEIFGSDSDND